MLQICVEWAQSRGGRMDTVRRLKYTCLSECVRTYMYSVFAIHVLASVLMKKM